MTTKDAVVAKLNSFRCGALYQDAVLFEHTIAVCKREILCEINHDELPDELNDILADMVVGRLLYDAKAAGLLPAETFDLSAPVKSITEGDVSVSFAGASDGAKTAEARFDALVDRLMHPPERVLGAYRRLRW